MGSDPTGAGRASGTTFSPDGYWWWDGSQWRPALSPDGLWRWDGRAWIPAGRPPSPAPRGGGALIAVVAFGGVLLLVLLLTAFVLYAMGSQITNVFSNLAAALSSP